MAKNKSLSIILPAYNEEFGLKETIRSLPVKKLKSLGYKVEVLVVDNNSVDGTAEVARGLGAKVVNERKQGYGHAYKRGFKESNGQYIVCLDSDGTYPGNSVGRFVKLLDKDYDFVTADRFSLGGYEMPWANRVGNIVLSVVFRILYGISLRDSQSGMWAIKRQLLDNLNIQSNGMALSQELKIDAIYKNKAKWIEVPISYSDRIGTSKLRLFRDGMDNLYQLLAKRIYYLILA